MYFNHLIDLSEVKTITKGERGGRYYYSLYLSSRLNTDSRLKVLSLELSEIVEQIQGRIMHMFLQRYIWSNFDSAS